MNFYVNLGLVFLLMVQIGCVAQEIAANKTPPISIAGENSDLAGDAKKPSVSKEDSLVLIKGFEGVVTMSDYNEDDSFIVFENADGSEWYRFTFYYDDSDGKFEYENKDFHAIGFHPDYFILQLKCRKNVSSGRYEVVVNETTGLTKYLPKDKRFKFQSWVQYIESAGGIDLPNEGLYLSKSGDLDTDVSMRKGFFYEPISAEGYWLKIRLRPAERTMSPKEEEVRRIKWRNETQLLVSTLMGD